MLKTYFISLGIAAASALAAPLDFSTVSKDSKWLLHLDFDAFRKTKVGSHVTEKILQPKIDESEDIQKMNLSINLKNISSITAYGPAFAANVEEVQNGEPRHSAVTKNGVLLIQTTADVKKDLDTLTGISSLSGGEILKMAQLKPYPVYSFKEAIFIAPNVQNVVIVSQSREQLENARQLLLGQADSLAKTKTFSDYPVAANGFFFLGLAEGLNENAVIPPQAQVLKEARGGRLILGENQDKVFANLIFKGKSDESSLKIQQIFQGIVALVSLSQDNKDLTDLARATTIASEGRNVSVNLQFPIGKVIHHLDENARH
jgi:hypothetical protein